VVCAFPLVARRYLFAVLLSSLVSANLLSSPVRTSDTPPTRLDKDARLAFIQRAQVWTPTDIPTMNLRAGPQGAGTFQPNEMVTCDYVEAKSHGSSRKFDCAVGPGDVVKVRYGAHNEEVQASVIATRLLWALGFAADRVYPVRLTCRGCSSDPWHNPGRSSGEHAFEPAVIEREPRGSEMTEGDKKAGWSWRELDLVNESQGGASVQQRDALKLLAVFMQHSDTKSEQQRLLCLPGGLATGGRCDKPFLMLHDVGLTFGHANLFNRSGSAGVDLEKWAATPIWKDPSACIGDLRRSQTGTLGNPRISEAGRLFLANLLVQLTDQQLADLFGVSGVGGVSEWVSVFKHKRDEIVMHHCPA
jgi:hypothetical protein